MYHVATHFTRGNIRTYPDSAFAHCCFLGPGTYDAKQKPKPQGHKMPRSGTNNAAARSTWLTKEDCSAPLLTQESLFEILRNYGDDSEIPEDGVPT